ncbi:MAG TPA: FkbM family methyltransferase [Rhizomicrobium sp.]|jgi:FkbM family methyltransferase|nr:FkbM family methyltransferase [Rhizomicrobium sp.]
MAITAPAFLMKYKWPRRRARDLWCFWYQVTRGRLFVTKRMGRRLLFDIDNTVDKYLLAYGFYEPVQKRILFAAAREAASRGGRCVFLDVGAHWGIYALWAEESGLFNRVVAVEADPRNLHQLYANLFLNDLSDRIDVVGAAAAGASGSLTFALASSRARVVSQVATPDMGGNFTTRTVTAVRLDDLETMTGGVIVAKIDVEGFEEEVLKGMTRLLAQNRCVLQVEVFGPSLAPFTETMRGLGYEKFAEAANDRYYRNF